jgi:small glutamine-rich tetratricopeptide repeat-containing protein alpha
VATNCVAEAFKVDPSDTTAVNDALGGKSLLDIYTVYEKLKGRSGGAPSSASASAQPPSTSTSSAGPDVKTKEEAEKLKSQGNAAIQKKDYDSAVDYYTQALNLVPLNPIYLSNRAAAHSGAGRHEDAVNDAEMAVAADPKFAKAWSRLGFAKFALGDSQGSLDAYKQGIEAEGSGGSEAMRKGYETAKRKVEEEGGDVDDVEERGVPSGLGAGGMPDLSNLASMFGGGSPGGGMPSMADMMQNPMMRQMASNLMSNPDTLNSMLNNPRLREMMGGAGGAGGAGGSGGGMPDIGTLMQDPSIMEM